jgi:hypothetical protein
MQHHDARLTRFINIPPSKHKGFEEHNSHLSQDLLASKRTDDVHAILCSTAWTATSGFGTDLCFGDYGFVVLAMPLPMVL